MSGRRALTLSLVAALGLCSLPTTGLGQAAGTASPGEAEVGARVAIAPLEVEGPLSDSDREELGRTLVAALERASQVAIGPDEVAAKTGLGDGACDSACVQRVAAAVDAAFVAVVALEVIDRDYAVKVRIYGETGEEVASSAGACEICGVVDVRGLLDSAVATLTKKLVNLEVAGPPILRVEGSPEGARVMIDGELVGTTPLEIAAPAGRHLVRISRDGFIPSEREVTFVDGITESLRVDLEAMPSALPSRGWGWASLGLGLATLGGAVTLTWLDGRPMRFGDRCAIPAPDPNYNVTPRPGGGEICRDLWHTKWGGLSAGIVGAALTTLGVLVLLDQARRSGRRARRAESRKTAFDIGPGGVTLRGRF